MNDTKVLNIIFGLEHCLRDWSKQIIEELIEDDIKTAIMKKYDISEEEVDGYL